MHIKRALIIGLAACRGRHRQSNRVTTRRSVRSLIRSLVRSPLPAVNFTAGRRKGINNQKIVALTCPGAKIFAKSNIKRCFSRFPPSSSCEFFNERAQKLNRPFVLAASHRLMRKRCYDARHRLIDARANYVHRYSSIPEQKKRSGRRGKRRKRLRGGGGSLPTRDRSIDGTISPGHSRDLGRRGGERERRCPRVLSRLFSSPERF